MQADFVLDYEVLAASRAQRVYVLARIRGEPMSQANARRPLNLSLVLDRSGSMQGDKLAYVKQAAQFLVQRLGAEDRLSLVSYNDRIKVEIPPGPAVEKDRLVQIIGKLTSGGTTNLSGGWLQGCQLVEEGMAEGTINRVLLLTDGLANVGITDPARLETLARQKREQGVTTTTMGVGMDFNEDLLTRMAAEGGGAFYFIDNPDRAPQIFGEELSGLMSVIGQNLVITLLPSPDVKMVRQLNAYPTQNVPGGVAFRLGDLFGDELKMLLLELSVPALDRLGEAEVARLRFEYDELGPDTVAHRVLELPIQVNVVSEADFEGSKPNADVVRRVLLLEAARARQEAVQHADRGDFAHASQVLKEAAEAIQTSGLTDAELEAQANMLAEEALDMELGPERYDAYSRKASTTKAYSYATPSMVFADALDETEALHFRVKASRPARERGGATPTTITWRSQTHPLDADSVRIGRASDNDIVLTETDVSAHHCQIVRDGDALYLEDLGSTNGTFANGGIIKDRFRLSVGDLVTVGPVLFHLR